MKPNRFFAIILLSGLFIGCNQQPIGKSLLSGAKSDTIEDLTSVPNDGDLDIQPDNTTMSVNIDDSDKVEITGSCKDLDRKNNRILVEVFAGENENTLSPYISNASSDKCLTIDAGLSTLDKCFWVTKGVGLKEEVGLPTEKSFPQCHNGRFGFSVKLGAVLVNPGPAPFKYLIRFKLRTLDGLLADTPFSKVTVSRDLVTPSITASFSPIDFGCKVVAANAARFNQDIQYKLERTNVDTVAPVFATFPYTVFESKDTSIVASTDASKAIEISEDSVFGWLDDNFSTTHASGLSPGVISGMTYTYTLTATDTRTGGFTYGIPPLNGPAPSKPSTSVDCEVPRPTALRYANPTPTVCPMSIPLVHNPGIENGMVRIEWGYSTSPNWIGPNANANIPIPVATCGSGVICDQVVPAIPATSYFFAVREVNSQDNSKGKWSPVAECRTP